MSSGRDGRLPGTAAGVGTASLAGWVAPLAARAAGKAHKACIVLWMNGGPSHIDTFDPRPDAPASVLDTQLGASDKRKLDEYLAAVRDIELRIERAEKLPPVKAPDY